jgi:hypothetical protein
MSTSMVSQAAEKAAERLLSQEGGGRLIATVQQGMREGRWDPNYQAALGQPHYGWTPGELYQFALLHTATHLDDLARVRIEVGTDPYRDACREENAAALADIAEPFVASLDMHQKTAEGDGKLWWTEEITLSVTEGGVDTEATIPACRNPVGVTLEVGSCNASTVRWHLAQHGAVARWPYGSEEIWLFYGLPDPRSWVLKHGVTGAMMRLIGDLDDS